MERRRTTRRVPDPEEPIACARLRTGAELAVVNVSSAGVLVEGAARLLPGRHLELRLATRHGGVLVRCRVVRSFVWHLDATAVRYRSALVFDRHVDVAAGGEAIPESPDDHRAA
jgi:hypothetical protein